MKKDVNKFIALAIVSAQIASDAGKRIHILDIKNKYAQYTGYDSKVHFQIRALEMIRTSKKTKFNYYVVRSADQNGYDSILVYFDFKIDGKRRQVSFHNPTSCSGKLRKYIGSGRVTRWNKDKNSSRDSCQELIDYYGL